MAKVFLNGEEVELNYEGEVHQLGDRVSIRTPYGTITGVAVTKGKKILASLDGVVFEFDRSAPKKQTESSHNGLITAAMPGLITDVLVQSGDKVKKGDKLAVLEAMKTQQPLVAPFDGKVEAVNVKKGDQVSDGQEIARVIRAESHE